MTSTEDLLAGALRARADRATYEPTPLGDVADHARVLRRRRTRTTALVAAAAVAALAVPVAVVLGTGDRATPEPAPAPPSVTTTTLGPLDDLPLGAPPRIDYVDDQTYVTATGDRIALPVVGDDILEEVAPFDGGVLMTTTDATSDRRVSAVSWVDRDGTVRWTRCGSDEIAVSADGAITGYASMDDLCSAWIGNSLTWARTDDGTVIDVQVTASGERVDPVGVTDEDMVYNVSDAQTGRPTRVYVTPLLGPPDELPGLETAADFHEESRSVVGTNRDGLAVVVHAPYPGEMVGGSEEGDVERLDVGSGDVRAELGRGRVPVSFSPDGRYVVTVSYGADGTSPIIVYDAATGAEVLVVAPPEPDGTVPDPWAVAWEDDTHLLVGALTTSSQAIVRIGLDGAVELATEPGRETLRGFVLAER